MLEDDLSRQRESKRKEDRSFGLVFSLFFMIVGIWPVMVEGSVRIWFIAAGLVCGALALAVPRVLAPLNRLWALLGLLLGRIVSPLVLGLLFFLVVTPTAWVMRLLGNDHFRLRRDPEAKSYWILRHPPGPDPGSFPQQS